MSNHHTDRRPGRYATRRKTFHVSQIAFPCWIASSVTASFTLSILPDSSGSTRVDLGGKLLVYRVILAVSFWSTVGQISRRGAECRFSCRKTSFWMCSTFTRVLQHVLQGVSNSNIKAGIAMGRSQQLFQLLYIVLQLPIDIKHWMLY